VRSKFKKKNVMATTSTHELQKLSFLEQFDLAGEETQGRRIK
jgi:hypothetical protein